MAERCFGVGVDHENDLGRIDLQDVRVHEQSARKQVAACHRLFVVAGRHDHDGSPDGTSRSLDHRDASDGPSGELGWELAVRLPDNDGVLTAVAVRR